MLILLAFLKTGSVSALSQVYTCVYTYVFTPMHAHISYHLAYMHAQIHINARIHMHALTQPQPRFSPHVHMNIWILEWKLPPLFFLFV